MPKKAGGKFSAERLKSPEGEPATQKERKRYEESLINQRASAVRRAIAGKGRFKDVQSQESDDTDTGR